MKLRYLLPVALLAAGYVAPSTAGDPPKKAVRQYTIEQFMKSIRFGGADLSPDEKTGLFSSNQDGIFNLYEIPFTGGIPKQLNFSKKENEITAYKAVRIFLDKYLMGNTIANR